MKKKPTPHRYILIISILLTACGITPAQPTTTAPAATETLAPFPTFVSIGKTTVQPTETPSQTPLPTITPWPTETPVTFTLTPPSSFPLDGYILVFRKDKYLYFQDGNNSPVQLTHGGEEPYSPMISDDNQRIIFSRKNISVDEGRLNIYSVNVDGGGEQVLITEQWLTTLGEGTKAYLPTFVPGTHQLLFNTRLCGSEEYDPLCSIGLYLVDTDTGEIVEFIHPGESRQYNRNGNFKTSPDGKMVSVFTPGHMDIFDISGKVIRYNILPYTPSTPEELFPVQNWLPDSSGLILTIPNAINYGWAHPTAVTFNVWHYTVANNVSVQIPFDPPPTRGSGGCFDIVRVSPDGKWIFYDGYMGNLDNGSTQLFRAGTCFMELSPWSPDSKYIAYDNYYLAGIEGSRIRIGGYFRKWIDANHFLYANIKDENITALIGEIVGEKILTYSFDPFSFIKPK